MPNKSRITTIWSKYTLRFTQYTRILSCYQIAGSRRFERVQQINKYLGQIHAYLLSTYILSKSSFETFSDGRALQEGLNAHNRSCVCVYVCTYIHIRIYIHMYICMRIRICMYVCIYIYIYIYIIYTHICTYVCICIFVCIKNASEHEYMYAKRT